MAEGEENFNRGRMSAMERIEEQIFRTFGVSKGAISPVFVCRFEVAFNQIEVTRVFLEIPTVLFFTSLHPNDTRIASLSVDLVKKRNI